MKSARVLGNTMRYVEVGSGPPVLFLHGNPTSSYLWRRVLGPVADLGYRCLALDLIGMGQSDRPALEYRLTDHITHVEGFLDAVGLARPVVVGHDWGAVIGLDLARRHPDRIRGVAVCEGHLHPIDSWADMDDGGRELFSTLRQPVVGERMVIDENFFVETVLPSGVARTLSADEMDSYRQPFLEPVARRPIWRWIQEIPIEGQPADVAAIVTANQDVLTDPRMPTLVLHGEPGAVIGHREVQWCRAHGRGMTIVGVGVGTHFLPEDQPAAIAGAIGRWLATDF